VKETVEGEWATAARFDRCLVTVRTASGGALASRSSSSCARVSDVDESSSCGVYLHALGFGTCGIEFDEYGPLFIGFLSPTHRGDKVLYFLSINRTLIRLRLEDFWKGVNFGFVMIRKPNS
jgi:hypothetical protein